MAITSPLFRIVGAAAFVSLILSSGCSSEQKSVDLRPPSEQANPQVMSRGQILVTSLAACGFCHGVTADPSASLSGGRIFRDKHGNIIAPNITPDPETGIGKWSVTEYVRAIRSNIAPDGRELSTEVHTGFAWMSDPDVMAVATYLRTVPPARVDTKRRNLNFLDRNTTGIWESRLEMEGYVPAIETRFTTEYGKYLVDQVAQCSTCHAAPGGIFGSGRYLGGGKAISVNGEEKIAPNITPSRVAGIGGWGEAGIEKFLKTGVTPDNHFVDSNFCPTAFYARAPDLERKAIARYLANSPVAE